MTQVQTHAFKNHYYLPSHYLVNFAPVTDLEEHKDDTDVGLC